ncbi:uncharacterized protein [Coffea arabica]|uniref:Reverse transcriptase domain-containing protein n=1 Tax=Coffea arabica TaxID=13443 RepID=A0ABM4V3E9_COFAR
MAGNLSPRLVFAHERDTTSTLDTLNIEEFNGQDKRGKKEKGIRARFNSAGNCGLPPSSLTLSRETEIRLGRAEDTEGTSGVEEDTEELNRARADLNRALAVEEQFWRQKARVKWLGCGDRNTRFFHAVVKQRRVQGSIHRVKDSTETWVEKDEDIAKAAVEYFSDLFSGSVEPRNSDLMRLIPKLISDEENARLATIPNIEEVRQLGFSMDGDSAAGPDGFTGKFFSFAWEVIDMVWRLISNVWFSVIINGSAHGFFKSSRGIRQGDPLSPVLFIIGSKLLLRGLNDLASRRNFIGFRVPAGCPEVTHLAFADDVLVFTNGSEVALKRVMRVLDDYQQASGQLINPQKSGYLVHPSLSPSRRRVIERITHFSRQALPIRYLGFPLYTGKSKAVYFGEVCQTVVANVMSWKSRLLSTGGRLVLIKHVLSAIPVHLLSAAVCPDSIFRRIEQICARFLWGTSGEGPKLQWISWSQLCLPVDEGGVGFRKLRDVYSAFSCKLWWNLRAGSSLWAEFMRAKYCKGDIRARWR